MASPAGPLVGLVTDFGESPYTGILRALTRCLGASPVDIDHSVPSYNVLAGAYVVYSTYKWLPRGSALVVVVDPGVGGPRRPVLIETRRYIMVGPDNGVLYPAAEDDGITSVYVLDPARVQEESRRRGTCPGVGLSWRVSHTFHGRDVFTPAAALAVQGVEPTRLGTETDPDSLERLELEWAEEEDDAIRLRVVYIDKFGNVALSIRSSPEPGLRVEIHAPNGVFTAKSAKTFSDVPIGDLVVYLNSFGFAEIAVNQGNAAARLGVRIGDTVTLRAK